MDAEQERLALEEAADRARIDAALGTLAEVIMNKLRPQSRWALQTAADAASTAGIGGTLVLKLPTRPQDPVDLTYITGTSGTTDVVSRWE